MKNMWRLFLVTVALIKECNEHGAVKSVCSVCHLFSKITLFSAY